MNKRVGIRNMAPRFAWMSFTLALLPNTGCSSGDAGKTRSTLAGDLARQLLTYWLL